MCTLFLLVSGSDSASPPVEVCIILFLITLAVKVALWASKQRCGEKFYYKVISGSLYISQRVLSIFKHL